MRRLAIRVQRDLAEVVLAELIELAPGGVEEVDHGDEVEYAIYGALGELPSLPDLKAAVGGALVSVSTSVVEDGWEDRWREFHQPLVIENRLRVRPPWEPRGEEDYDISIDPGRAFGTGAHPTTRLCLELLLDLEAKGSLIDLGCGSGVIAVLAAQLGFEPVTALDYDQLAVDASLTNAAINKVEVSVGRFDLREQQLPNCDLLVANILAPVLIELAGKLPDQRPRLVMLSGLLVTQLDGIAERWGGEGYSEIRRLTGDEWGALLLQLK